MPLLCPFCPAPAARPLPVREPPEPVFHLSSTSVEGSYGYPPLRPLRLVFAGSTNGNVEATDRKVKASLVAFEVSFDKLILTFPM